MNNRRLYLALAAIIASVIALLAFIRGHGRSDAAKAVAEETLWQAQYSGFPYLDTLQQAESGNVEALTAMMRFSTRADAAGALGHGMVLVGLLDRVGEEAFCAAIGGLTSPERDVLRHSLEGGEAYSRRPSHRAVRDEYPLVHAVLNSR